MTVKKVVDGQLGDRDKAFEFVIKNANQNPSGGWHYEKSDGTTGTIPADGKFTLKHNEDIMITGLPTDQSILIEETDYSAEGYRTFYSTDENGNFQESRSYFDHRVIDGADGARFITIINNTLSDIRRLVM